MNENVVEFLIDRGIIDKHGFTKRWADAVASVGKKCIICAVPIAALKFASTHKEAQLLAVLALWSKKMLLENDGKYEDAARVKLAIETHNLMLPEWQGKNWEDMVRMVTWQ